MKNAKILVVESHKLWQHELREQLVAAGHHVVEAASAEEAYVRFCGQGPFQGVLVADYISVTPEDREKPGQHFPEVLDQGMLTAIDIAASQQGKRIPVGILFISRGNEGLTEVEAAWVMAVERLYPQLDVLELAKEDVERDIARFVWAMGD